ncbi:hypothetical protein [Streptomyces sp. NPDC021356]|uniref:hypothetical protein n=1 Tax=Streptomyces sp. NPDC021356 TaxID=3154900 RepID=UPI0033D6E8AC
MSAGSGGERGARTGRWTRRLGRGRSGARRGAPAAAMSSADGDLVEYAEHHATKTPEQ